MDKNNPPPASSAPIPRPQSSQEAKRSNDAELHSSNTTCEHVFITQIHASNVVLGLRRLPAGFYIAVEVDGRSTKTSNEHVLIGKDSVVQWNEEILLPSERSSTIVFTVYASVEFGSRLGSGELLAQFETSLADLLDRNVRLQSVGIPDDELLSPCLSLDIIIERRVCDGCKCKTRFDLPDSDPMDQLGQLADNGHRALQRYRRLQDQRDIDEAIECFTNARDICPTDHAHRSAVLFNLATASAIHCQVNNDTFNLDMTITLYQDALQLRPDDHMDHCMTALELSFAFLIRFWKRGDESNRTQAEHLLRRVMELSSRDSHAYRAAGFALQMTEISVSSETMDSGIFNAGLGSLDPEAVIRRARAMLLDASDHDPRRPQLLAGLGTFLCERFESNGNLRDIHEAISALENAVKLIPDEHPNKPIVLDLFGIALFRRFARLSDVMDINRAVSIFEDAVRLLPNSSRTKPPVLNNLGNALSRRFACLGNLADINRSISMLEEAVHLAPDDLPEKSDWIYNLSLAFSSRSEHLGDLADAKNSISTLEQAVYLTPNYHPDKTERLNKLGNLLYSRFGRLGDPADINKAISTFEEAVLLTPSGHPERGAWLNNLGNSFSSRFDHFSDPADINKAISLQDESARSTPDNHPDKPARLYNLGKSLSSRFQLFDNLTDLSKSIVAFEGAIRLAPDDYPHKSLCFSALGTAFFRRFERLGNLVDINGSISMVEKAVQLTPHGHHDRARRLSNLGISLLRRFERSGDLADISKSISVSEEADHLTPRSHPSKAQRLKSLGHSLFRRYEHIGDLVDINRSILLIEEALRLTPRGHSERPEQLHGLGNSLLVRFERLGDLVDINRSISVKEEAIQLAPYGHPDKPRWLDGLGNSLFCRFRHLGDLSDVNKAIILKQEAVSLAPDSHPEQPMRLSNLGVAFLYRFERLGGLTDVDNAISVFEHSLKLLPQGHQFKSTWLNNLGNSLLYRFQHLKNPEDINKSILMKEEVLDLTPDGHPQKPVRLNNLGIALTSCFDHSGNLEDINRAILVIHKAVDLTPDGHSSKPFHLVSLGEAFLKAFQHTHDPSNLSSASLYLSAASLASTGPISTRFKATHGWIVSAQLEGNTQALLEAHSTAMSLLPQLAWLGLPLTERHRVLLQAADVARDAAAAALGAGYPEKAVEWLEQGCSIVWNQFLQLRTPVDDLSMQHPALAHQLQKISRELEHASSDHSSTSNQLIHSSVNTNWSLEQETQRLHDLTLRHEKLLAEIRSLPGFEQFLLPKTIEQIADLLPSGPVVYLNASKQRCDALIIVAELENVISIPLNVSYEEMEALQGLLYGILKHNQLVFSRQDISELISLEGSSVPEKMLSLLLVESSRRDVERGARIKPQKFDEYSTEEVFQYILAYLWHEIVNPILHILGFSTPSPHAEELAHIFWCTTGPFTFLPIHAAGLYGTEQESGKLSDFAISSYIPTLSSLSSSVQKDPNGLLSSIDLVTVPQPATDGLFGLVSVKEEINHIKTLSSGSPFVNLQESCGTVEDVMEKMKKANWVHFACHGVQDPDNPLDSGLCLADRRRLKLSDIIKLSCPQGGLAFLSACQTAQGDKKLSEESVHLAAGMLLAGYGGVIATMWAIMDSDAPKVTRDVYKYLFQDGKIPNSTEAAKALHFAIQQLQKSGAPFTSWVPFIHVGK